MLRKLIYEAMGVFCLALLLSIGSYALRPEALPLTAEKTETVPALSQDLPYVEISLEDARQLFSHGQVLFADARPLMAFEQGHIRGALHLDPNAIDQWIDDMMANTPADTPIIAYCEGIQCSLSKELAEKLSWLGYEQVYYLVDGWGRWCEHHLPVE